MELTQINIEEAAEIELRSITGFTSKGTMKLKGDIKGQEVVILIDSGATNNFIHEIVAEAQGLNIEPGTQFGVTIGDGTRCKGKGICRRVELRLKELTIVADFLAVELGNVDVVLGMQWLDTTGTTKVHWPSLTMTFWVKDRQIVLKGDPSLIKAECSLKTLEKTWDAEDQGFLLEFKNYGVEIEDKYDTETEKRGDKEELSMIQSCSSTILIFLKHQRTCLQKGSLTTAYSLYQTIDLST